MLTKTAISQILGSELIALYSRRNSGFSCGNCHFSGANSDDSAIWQICASGSKPIPLGITTIPAGTAAILVGSKTIPSGVVVVAVETGLFPPERSPFPPEWE